MLSAEGNFEVSNWNVRPLLQHSAFSINEPAGRSGIRDQGSEDRGSPVPWTPDPPIPESMSRTRTARRSGCWRWPPVVPVTWPNVLPAAVLKPVVGLPQRTEFVDVEGINAELGEAAAAHREALEQRHVEVPEPGAVRTVVARHVALHARASAASRPSDRNTGCRVQARRARCSSPLRFAKARVTRRVE